MEEDIYKEILCDADDCNNVLTMNVYLKNGSYITASNSKRLSQVGVSRVFLMIEGTLNSNTEEKRYYIPYENINFIEIINTNE